MHCMGNKIFNKTYTVFAAAVYCKVLYTPHMSISGILQNVLWKVRNKARLALTVCKIFHVSSKWEGNLNFRPFYEFFWKCCVKARVGGGKATCLGTWQCAEQFYNPAGNKPPLVLQQITRVGWYVMHTVKYFTNGA